MNLYFKSMDSIKKLAPGRKILKSGFADIVLGNFDMAEI